MAKTPKTLRKPSQPQTPVKSTKALGTEVASATTDYTRTLWNGILKNPDPVLSQIATRVGLEAYDEAEQDAHVQAVIQKRKLAVIARPWLVKPISEDPKDIERATWIEGILGELNVDGLTVAMLDAVIKGVSFTELVWRTNAEGFLIPSWKHRNPRRFMFAPNTKDGGWELRLLKDAMDQVGTAVPPFKFIVHRYNPKYDNPYGNGLGPNVYWPVYFKKRGLGFWLTFADKFGSPTVVGEYDGALPERERGNLLRAISALSQETGIIVPKQVAVRLLEAQRTGASDTYESLLRYLDEQISEVVLGESLTTTMSGGGGSYAAAQTHNMIRMEIVQADADMVSANLNETLVRWLMELNFPGEPCPTFWRDSSDVSDLYARAKRDIAVYNMGFKPTLDYIHATYGSGWVERLVTQEGQLTAATADSTTGEPQGMLPDPSRAVDIKEPGSVSLSKSFSEAPNIHLTVEGPRKGSMKTKMVAQRDEDGLITGYEVIQEEAL